MGHDIAMTMTGQKLRIAENQNDRITISAIQSGQNYFHRSQFSFWFPSLYSEKGWQPLFDRCV